jgi:CheY-like chemotaxis protein
MAEARRVLVVEDSAEASAVLCELVDAWGYQAEAAEDSWHALALVHSDAPDVIITDLSLPDGRACEVIRAVKASASGRASSGYGRTNWWSVLASFSSAANERWPRVGSWSAGRVGSSVDVRSPT